MKAVSLEKQSPIEELPLNLSEFPVPEPKAEEVLVKVEACGVCRTDLHIVEGDLPLRASPTIPGHQIVGTVAEAGAGVTRFTVGERVGIAWLHHTCSECFHCRRGEENLCSEARFTGWDVPGGFAEFTTVPETFAYALPSTIPAPTAAPLLCAGIIGYRTLRRAGVEPGRPAAIWGYGAAGHIALQLLKYWECPTLVFTRTRRHQEEAKALGAEWVGTADQIPPFLPHSAAAFFPNGSLVPRALELLEPGGILALGGIHLSEIPSLNYDKHLYRERTLTSVTNATRRDGEDFLLLAQEIPIRTRVKIFPLEKAAEALQALKESRLAGAAVLVMNSKDPSGETSL